MKARAVGYFRPGDSWLHRRNPLTKLLGLAWMLLTAFLLPPVALPVLVGMAIAVAWSAGLLGQLLRSLRIPALLFTSILLVNAFFYPEAAERLIPIGPVGLSWEGIWFGATSAGRIVVVFLAAILFLFTTLPDDLLEALVARGVNHRLAFVILSAVQLVPRLQARAAAILDAQQARGLAVTGSFVTRVRALVPLIGPIVLGSLIDVRERTFALEARAFGAIPARTAYRLAADPPIDRWLRIALLLASVAVVILAFSGVLAT
ncbi:energy-coupling factor transporter transmembrane component T [soil metagenome]